MTVTVFSPLEFFGDLLGLFTAFILDLSVFPCVVAIAALCAVLGCIRLALYLFNA